MSYISSINITKFTRSLNVRVPLGHKYTESNDGYILSIESITGKRKQTFSVAYAPFQGFHQFNEDEDLSLFKKLSERTPKRNLYSPYGRFIYDLIFLRLAHRPSNSNDIQSNILITDTNYLSEIKGQSGTFKIKIGRNDNDINLINSFLENNQKALLRLDGNQALSLEQLKHYITEIPLGSIEYFEEPTSSPEHWTDFPNVNFALDENLAHYLESNKLPKNCSHFIVKPSLGLGIEGSLNLIGKQVRPIVISSVYNGPFNQFGLEYLVGKQNKILKTCAGIDTIKFFD